MANPHPDGANTMRDQCDRLAGLLAGPEHLAERRRLRALAGHHPHR